MSSPDKHRASDHEAIEARAAAWLAERDYGLSVDEQKAFVEWRASDIRHEAAVARLETAWAALAQLSKFRLEAKQHRDADLLAPRRARVVRFSRRLVFAAAAAMMVGLTALIYWSTLPRGELIRAAESVLDSHRFVTNSGEYRRATLADGSTINLNENSAVTLAFSVGERRLRLERGEVHFTVAKDKSRPFIVEASRIAVRAVGTSFNVKLDSRRIEVVVTEGVVSFRDAEGVKSEAEKPPVMVAGERVVVSIGASGIVSRIDRPAATEIKAALAWQNPGLVFRSTSLAAVVAEFNRRNAIQIQIADDELADDPIVGNFQADDIESFVIQMENNKDVRVERPAANSVILHRAR